MKKNLSLLLMFFALGSLTLNLNAQSKIVAKNNPKSIINKVQELYFKRDFNGGSELAKSLIKQFPDNLELQAWYVMSLARSDNDTKSLEYAEDLVKRNGENLWTLLALTVAKNYVKPKTAIVTGEKLIKFAPDDTEAIFAYNIALFQNDKNKESFDWLEKNQAKIKDRSRFLSTKAQTVYYLEKEKERPNIQLVFDLFAQALKANPLSVNVNYLYGWYLANEKRVSEALPFLKKASNLSPNGSDVTEKYWKTIESQTNKTDEQKQLELDNAISQFLIKSKNSPESLVVAWSKYRDLTGWKELAKPEDLKKRDYFENFIRQKYPNTKYDEEIIFTQIRTVYGKYFAKNDGSKYLEIFFKKKANRTPDEIKFFVDYEAKEKLYQKEQITLRRVFLQRPQHFNLSNLGDVYLNLLYQIAGKKDSTDDEISALLKGTIENNKNYYSNLNTYIAGILLNRQKEQPKSAIAKDAEKYARLGITESENKIKQLPKDAKPEKIYELQANPINTLAEVLISQEKLDEAEKLLLQASEMKDTSGNQNFTLENANIYTAQLWAKFYVAKKDWAKAEALYIKNTYNDDSAKVVFEKFYEKKNGNKDGFEVYYADIQIKLKVAAQEKIVQSRIKDAQLMMPFSLKNLDDKIVSSAELKGKVIVINVWGTWCGPCVAEMPELQRVYEKYKDDKNVAILTIDSNDELATVKKFMAEKKFTLPVLIEDNYIFKTPQFKGMAVFPTTIFIDKSGKVSFVVRGASDNLFETFSWRIDTLKDDK